MLYEMNSRVLKILATAAIIIFCLQAFSDNKADVDLWGNVGFVRTLPWSPQFHRVNIFSFTESARPWINHEWLAQYILHVTHKHLGNTGLLALKIILGLSVIFLINLSMKTDCRSGSLRFLYLLLAISTMGYGFSTRPHLFTYLMYALFLFLLRQYGKNKFTILISIPILGVLWTNLHGAFFIGIILAGIYAALELIKTRASSRHAFTVLTATLLFICVTFINPYGFRLWEFIFQSGAKFRPYLSEWAPFHPVKHLTDHPDFIALSVLSLLAICFSHRQKDITWLAILTASFAGALFMRRNIPLFAITTCFVVPQHVQDVADKPLARISTLLPRPVLIGILSLFIALSAWYTFTFNKTNPFEIEVPRNRFPVEVVSFMKANNITGNALVFFNWAEYCIWKLYPNCKLFLDGRLWSAYSTETINDYFNFLYPGKNWDNALKNYSTDIVLIHKGNPVHPRILQQNDWIRVYGNNIADLFLKETAHKDLLRKIEAGAVKIPTTQTFVFFP